jgi:TonB family protein
MDLRPLYRTFLVVILAASAAYSSAQATAAAPVAPIVPTRDLIRREFSDRSPFDCGTRPGVHYTTQVRVVVDAAGQPSHVEVAESSGRPCLDDIALAAAKEARFIPATGDDGHPVASTITVPVNQPFRALPTPEQRAMHPTPVTIPEVEVGPCRLTASVAVTIQMTVPVDGVPTGLKILRSGGDACLDRQALKIAAQYRFKPAMKDGQPFEVSMAVSINFQKF